MAFKFIQKSKFAVIALVIIICMGWIYLKDDKKTITIVRNITGERSPVYHHAFNRYVYFNTIQAGSNGFQLFEDSAHFTFGGQLAALAQAKRVNGHIANYSNEAFSFFVNYAKNRMEWQTPAGIDSFKIPLNSLSYYAVQPNIYFDWYSYENGTQYLLCLDTRHKKIDTLFNINTLVNAAGVSNMCKSNLLQGHVFNAGSNTIGYFFFKINKVLLYNTGTKKAAVIQTKGTNEVPAIVTRTTQTGDGQSITACNDDDFPTQIQAARILDNQLFVLTAMGGAGIHIDVFDAVSGTYSHSLALHTKDDKEQPVDFGVSPGQLLLITSQNNLYAFAK
jgi:hypothetical protein